MGRCRAPLQSTLGLRKPACCHHLQRKSGFHLQLIVRPKERPAGLLKHSQPGWLGSMRGLHPTPSPSKWLSLGKGEEEKAHLKQGSHPTNALPVGQVSLQRDQTKGFALKYQGQLCGPCSAKIQCAIVIGGNSSAGKLQGYKLNPASQSPHKNKSQRGGVLIIQTWEQRQVDH